MNKYKHLYKILFPLVALVCACNVSKNNIQTPAPELPNSFRSSTSTDTASIADIPYKTFFADEQLVKLINTAIAKNYDMQLAMKNIETSELLLKQVKWNYLPSVNGNIAASLNRPSNNSLNGLSLQAYGIGSYIEDFSANVAASWEADLWKKIENQRKIALAQYLQSQEARNLIQTGLVANIANGYYNLLMLDKQLAIAKRNVALNDSTLNIIRLEYEAGQVTLLAVQQAEAQKLAAAQLIPQFEQNISLQENALRILTGELPDAVKRDETLDQAAFAHNLSTGIPTALVRRRPDVRSNELALTIANAKVGINNAQLYPSLILTASTGLNSFRASDWISIPASLFGLATGGLTQPIFAHKQLLTNYKVSLVEREQTVIRFRQSVLVAVGEVSDALVKIEKLKQQQIILKDRVGNLEKAIINADLLFRSGRATYLEVITAQSNVLQSELELATLKRAELVAVSDLYRSLGGGWK